MNHSNEDGRLFTARLAEAQSLLAVNQRRRTLAEGTSLLIALSALLVGTAALWAGRAVVFLPLPPVALLLTSLSFQQYADVTVLGTARSLLEDAVNGSLTGPGLIYETRIAGIRKNKPLVFGVRYLQGLVRFLSAAGAPAGLVIAFNETPLVTASYAAVIAASAVSCLMSYRDMRRAGTETLSALGDLA